VWGGTPRWQREIAFWNVGAAIIVFLTLRLRDARLANAASPLAAIDAVLAINAPGHESCAAIVGLLSGSILVHPGACCGLD
jgi:hypothetical protein